MSPPPTPTLPSLAAPPPGAPALAPPRTLALYLYGLVLTPILLFTLAFFLIPTGWFARHSGNLYLANLGYAETLHHADCQILLYGDSAALVGADPLILQRLTGLSACNIAEFAGMTMVNGMLVPDRFLARNPRPRYLVFLFSPEGFSPRKQWAGVSTFESISYRLQHQRDWSSALLFLQHPADFLAWLELGLRLGITHAASRPFTDPQLHLRDPHRGQLPLGNDAATQCGPAIRFAEPDPTWIANLRATYGVQGTRVLVDVVPEPVCDLSYPLFQGKFTGLTDNTLHLYPIADYVQSGRLHMNAIGSERLSTEIGNQIAALERGR